MKHAHVKGQKEAQAQTINQLRSLGGGEESGRDRGRSELVVKGNCIDQI